MHNTLRNRLEEIVDLASRAPPGGPENARATTSAETDEFVNGFDEWEKEILRMGQETTKRLKHWEANKSA